MSTDTTSLNLDLTTACDAVFAALQAAPDIRPCGENLTASCLKSVNELLTLDLDFYPADAFSEIDSSMDVSAICEKLLRECGELVPKTHEYVRFVWRVKAGQTKGKTVLGKCGVISKKERQIQKLNGATPVQLWEITLALDTWILLTDEERKRLIHHELMHCDVNPMGDPTTRTHDIEDFGSTLARFGTAGESQDRVIGLAMQNCITVQMVKTWVCGPLDAPLLGKWVDAPEAPTPSAVQAVRAL